MLYTEPRRDMLVACEVLHWECGWMKSSLASLPLVPGNVGAMQFWPPVARKPQRTVWKNLFVVTRMGAQIRLEKDLCFILHVPKDFQEPLIVEADLIRSPNVRLVVSVIEIILGHMWSIDLGLIEVQHERAPAFSLIKIQEKTDGKADLFTCSHLIWWFETCFIHLKGIICK